jgi:hypothetical protein
MSAPASAKKATTEDSEYEIPPSAVPLIHTPTVVNGEEKLYGAPLTKVPVGDAPVGGEHMTTPAFYVAKDGTGDW